MADTNEDMDVMNEDDMDDEEFFEAIKGILMAIQAIIHLVHEFMSIQNHRRIERPLTRRPVTTDGYIYINKILDEDPRVFRHVYRMFPDVFRKLCSIIRQKTLLRDTRHICIEEMLAIFLLTIGQNNRYSQAILTFRRSHYTCSRSFNKVLKALNTLAPELMVKPVSMQAKIRESTRFYPYFKDCMGAIDGTHIPAMVKGPEISAYRNRYGKTSQNVLAATNFDLEFIYVLSGWEGSAHDSRVLNDALTRRNGLKLPPGKFLLVDAGFANRRGFLAPIRGVRYHLKEFSGQGRHPENARELFNLRHASLRNVVERIFGVFKSRFTIFKTAPPFPFKTQAELVLACAGLHNFLRKECRSDLFPVESEDEEDSEHEEDPEDEFQTQDQQREEANDWRMEIANHMWRDARPAPDPEPNPPPVVEGNNAAEQS